MKKKVIIGLSLLSVLIILVVTILITNKNENTFYLEDNYYGTNSMTEIKMDELNQLIDNKESFAVFVYQPLCITSSNFESILLDFLEDNQISIYKIAFSSIKDTDIGKSVKYYPSVIIYNKGKMIDYLEADSDADVEYYNSKEGFESWFTKYVKLRNNTTSSNSNSSNNTSNVSEEDNIDIENIVKEDNKVNIYFFWGNGCPHCAKEFEFFESIKEEYGNYYNLYTFETWYNDENAKLLYTFAENMNDEVSGVPYTIIGEQSFSGFSEKYKSDFIDAIKVQYKNDFDVYFDKIKK